MHQASAKAPSKGDWDDDDDYKLDQKPSTTELDTKLPVESDVKESYKQESYAKGHGSLSKGSSEDVRGAKESKDARRLSSTSSTNPYLSYIYNHDFCFDLDNSDMLLKRRQNMSYEDLSSLQHLAKGSNSNIYTAVLAGQKDKVVVKQIMDDPPDKENAFREFIIEHEILMRLSHPNVVDYYGGGFTGRRGRHCPFLVLERLKGKSLAEMLNGYVYGQATPFLPLYAIAYIGRSFASALTYLHEQFHPDGLVIHRDLKPDNIGFTEDGILKLMDFGLCACVQRNTELANSYALTGQTGSLRYMAPEVMRCELYSEKVDVYSFGLIMWQVATGLSPYAGMNKNDIFYRVAKNHERPQLNMIPRELAMLLERTWHPNFRERHTAAQLLSGFENLSAANPFPEKPTAYLKTVQRQSLLKKFQNLKSLF